MFLGKVEKYEVFFYGLPIKLVSLNPSLPAAPNQVSFT